VFLGVTGEGLNNKEEAISAYKQAIGISPDEALAWQGLATLYEKTDHQVITDMVEVYQKLIQIEISKTPR